MLIWSKAATLNRVCWSWALTFWVFWTGRVELLVMPLPVNPSPEVLLTRNWCVAVPETGAEPAPMVGR